MAILARSSHSSPYWHGCADAQSAEHIGKLHNWQYDPMGGASKLLSVSGSEKENLSDFFPLGLDTMPPHLWHDTLTCS